MVGFPLPMMLKFTKKKRDRPHRWKHGWSQWPVSNEDWNIFESTQPTTDSWYMYSVLKISFAVFNKASGIAFLSKEIQYIYIDLEALCPRLTSHSWWRNVEDICRLFVESYFRGWSYQNCVRWKCEPKHINTQ